MKIECEISAFLVEGKPFTKLTDDIETWQDIERLYTVTEVIDIPDDLIPRIVEEQKIQMSKVFLKYITDGFSISRWERINHKIEVEHRQKYKEQLLNSGKYTKEAINDLTNRFFVMVCPTHKL